MELSIRHDQPEKLIAFLMSIHRHFPEAVNDLLQLTRSAKNGITIEIVPLVYERTRPQEKYYRMWVKAFADFTGYPPDEMHDEMLCITFGTDLVKSPFGGYTRVPHKRSAGAHRVDYSALIETLIRVAAEFGFIVPPPQKQEKIDGSK